MIEGIFGKKIGMTRVFAEDGSELQVTVIKTEPCYVVQRKVKGRDGYEAVKLGAAEKKEKRETKPMRGVFKKAKTPCLYHLAEFSCDESDEYKAGSVVKCADLFKTGDYVDVSGRTKGKGFQGGMKRWGFHGGPASHGSMHGRSPGSIGQSSWPSRVFKGLKMAGHMGNTDVTTQNMMIVDIRPEEELLLIKGAVPGPVNGYIKIKRALKRKPVPESEA